MVQHQVPKLQAMVQHRVITRLVLVVCAMVTLAGLVGFMQEPSNLHAPKSLECSMDAAHRASTLGASGLGTKQPSLTSL